ncbi:ArsR/SmtB family transcription factor [Halorientalis brevis]|uniref:ArsR/SmtB family transcription factor n=1 Tax=Halorientalis brevis TaxID=1126241 RepID=A0ABD6CFR4_9EURY|nr:helix-turn-helix domain-containing protein [Halorientalis brevis]
MSDDAEFDDIADILADEYARSILRATSVKPLAAEEITEKYDMSKPTIYRRLERLCELDLVETRQRVDLDGHHAKEYYATLSSVTIDLENGHFALTVERTETDAADRLTKLFEEL